MCVNLYIIVYAIRMMRTSTILYTIYIPYIICVYIQYPQCTARTHHPPFRSQAALKPARPRRWSEQNQPFFTGFHGHQNGENLRFALWWNSDITSSWDPLDPCLLRDLTFILKKSTLRDQLTYSIWLEDVSNKCHPKLGGFSSQLC